MTEITESEFREVLLDLKDVLKREYAAMTLLVGEAVTELQEAGATEQAAAIYAGRRPDPAAI